MPQPLEQLQQTLRGHQQSLTQPRRAVFQALLGSDPLTMHELVTTCSSQADRASVYRTIRLYEQLGIVHRLQTGWKYKLELSDAFLHHHHHMHCTSCGTIMSLPEDAQLEARLHQLATTADFHPISHQIEIRGLCRHCQPVSKL